MGRIGGYSVLCVKRFAMRNEFPTETASVIRQVDKPWGCMFVVRKVIRVRRAAGQPHVFLGYGNENNFKN